MNRFRNYVLFFCLSVMLASAMGCSQYEQLKKQVEAAEKHLEAAKKQVEGLRQQIIDVNKKIEDGANDTLKRLEAKLAEAELRADLAERKLEAYKNKLNESIKKEKSAINKL